jgi:hypothetical protein
VLLAWRYTAHKSIDVREGSYGTRNRDFETALHVRVPIALTEAVMRAAEERMMTSSDYIRQALIDRLKLEKRSVKTLTEA